MWHSDWSIQSEGEVTSAIPSRKRRRQQVVQHYNIHVGGYGGTLLYGTCAVKLSSTWTMCSEHVQLTISFILRPSTLQEEKRRVWKQDHWTMCSERAQSEELHKFHLVAGMSLGKASSCHGTKDVKVLWSQAVKVLTTQHMECCWLSLCMWRHSYLRNLHY